MAGSTLEWRAPAVAHRLQQGVRMKMRALPGILFLLASSCSDWALDGSSPTAPSPYLNLTPTTCTDTLENVLRISSCPASYSPAADGPNQLCRDYYDSFEVGTGATHSFITNQYGAGATNCIYDAGSAALVGMRVSDDGNYFCDGKSNSIEAGDVAEGEWPPEQFSSVSCTDSDLPPPVGSPSPTPRACPGGTAPTFLLTSLNNLDGFSVGATDVYLSESDGVWRVPKAGGYERVVYENGYAFRVLGNDANALYWSSSPNPPSLYRLPFDNGVEPQLLVEGASHSWTLSGSLIYYLSSSGQLRAIPTSGGDSTLLADGSWTSAELAADATGVYWYSDPSGTEAAAISKYTFATASVTAFAPVTGGARFVQTAGDRVIWVDAQGVWSSTSNGNRSSLSSATSVRGLASDGVRVYWAQSTGSGDVFSDILALPLAGGGEPQKVACHVYAVRGLRADAAAVYYDSTIRDVVARVPVQ